MSNIYDIANELSRGIRDLPEYKAVLASKEAIDADADAKALFGDYLAFQQEIHGVIQSGQMPTEDQQKKMQDFAEKLQGKGTKNKIVSKSLQVLDFAFSDKEFNNSVKLLGRIGNDRVYRYIKKDYLDLPEIFEKYNILVPEANGSGAIGEVLSTPLIGEPLIGHTDTFLSIGAFDTVSEAENCLKYVKTKFCRAMLGVLKITQHNSRNTWLKVPLQDFTSTSDIDWSQSIAEVDQQLYKKYGLSEEEIQFIESKVKEME